MSLPRTADLIAYARAATRRCGVDEAAFGVGAIARTPINGAELAQVVPHDPDCAAAAATAAHQAYLQWRTTPAPARADVVKAFARLAAERRDDLAGLITLETGKIRSEALGEVQEALDVAEYAVGLSRRIGGRTMPSERPGHRLMETWHPLGAVGVISAFNFPVAVWAWNTMIALVCGDPVVWKPSEKTPLTSLAVTALLQRAIAESSAPPHLHQLLVGDGAVGQAVVDAPEIALISATGSTRMGRTVGARVAAQLGRSLLELGGNNAAVVTASADLDLAAQAILFAAVGTAGQRCTTTRRLIAHADIAEMLADKLTQLYRRLPIGDPTADGTLVGPLIDAAAGQRMEAALADALIDSGHILVGGGRRWADEAPNAYYPEPAIVAMPAQTDIVRQETFAPILYLLTYYDFDEAIAINNDVPQGLSASIFTRDLAEAERFIGPDGADCGIVNVNTGTSGAEIGGAFGGEKDTGGGRESGSDAWRAYMRQATNTINYSQQLALAQGVTFG